MATFDNRFAAIDYYLQRGDARELARFLSDGKTHWLTRDEKERFEITTFDPTRLTNLLKQTGYECLEVVGKTVLPMRHHRHLLEDPVERRQWTQIEKRLCRDLAALGRASHLQIAARTR